MVSLILGRPTPHPNPVKDPCIKYYKFKGVNSRSVLHSHTQSLGLYVHRYMHVLRSASSLPFYSFLTNNVRARTRTDLFILNWMLGVSHKLRPTDLGSLCDVINECSLIYSFSGIDRAMRVSWSGCPFGFDHLADESDCYVFYHCFESPWGTVMIPKTCGPHLMFNPGMTQIFGE